MATKKSKSILVSSSIASIPHDILISHIFVRLPVRSISHCKCVCKRWNRSLTEPYFISMHFKHQKIHNHQHILCGPTYYRLGLPGVSEEDYCTKFQAFYGRFYSVHLSSTEKAVAFRLPGFQNLLENYEIHETVGNCNGIVCIQLFDKKDMDNKKHLLFGNTSSGLYKVIPHPVPFPIMSGFTYDSSHDDYICLMVHHITRNLYIYSLKSNSWRIKLGSFQPTQLSCNVGVALDMSFYWLDDSSNVIEYDVKDDQFREIPLTNEMTVDDQFREIPLPIELTKTTLSVKVVGRSICVTNVCLDGTDHVEAGQVEMWLISKPEEKWSKFMSVNLKEEFGIFFIYPLSFTRDGKVLCDVKCLLDKCLTVFVVIDPKTESVEDLTVLDETGGDWLAPEEFRFGDGHMSYTDTLVSPN